MRIGVILAVLRLLNPLQQGGLAVDPEPKGGCRGPLGAGVARTAADADETSTPRGLRRPGVSCGKGQGQEVSPRAEDARRDWPGGTWTAVGGGSPCLSGVTLGLES